MNSGRTTIVESTLFGDESEAFFAGSGVFDAGTTTLAGILVSGNSAGSPGAELFDAGPTSVATDDLATAITDVRTALGRDGS